MKIDQEGLNLIKKFEGCNLKAYVDPATHAEPITIGYGSTHNIDGSKFKLGDIITQIEADELLMNTIQSYVDCVGSVVKVALTQHQLNGLVSLCYNIGCGNFQKSTLLKKVNMNPNDPTIVDQFKIWNKGNGKVLSGLTSRRIEEARIYFIK